MLADDGRRELFALEPFVWLETEFFLTDGREDGQRLFSLVENPRTRFDHVTARAPVVIHHRGLSHRSQEDVFFHPFLQVDVVDPPVSGGNERHLDCFVENAFALPRFVQLLTIAGFPSARVAGTGERGGD